VRRVNLSPAELLKVGMHKNAEQWRGALKGRVDLHIHSGYSPGATVPPRLIARAAEFMSLKAFSLVDHRTIKGYIEASEHIESQQFETRIVPGFEFTSTDVEGDLVRPGERIDILGYCFDVHSDALKNGLEEVRRRDELKAQRRVDAVNRELVNLNLIEARDDHNALTLREMMSSETGGESIGRAAIMNALRNRGFAGMADRFKLDRLFREVDSPDTIFPLRWVMKLIKDSEGLSFVAHPFEVGTLRRRLRIKRTDDKDLNWRNLRNALRDREREHDQVLWKLAFAFKDMGGDGIEAAHCHHMRFPGSRQKLEWLAKLAGLFASGGSDFHIALSERDLVYYDMRTLINMGLAIPEEGRDETVHYSTVADWLDIS